MQNNISGSVLTPFDQAKANVFNMAMKIYESSIIENIMQTPTDENLKVLVQYIFSDPNWPPKNEPPN